MELQTMPVNPAAPPSPPPLSPPPSPSSSLDSLDFNGWTGPNFYGNAEGHRFLFSPKADSWLYYDSSAKNFYVYKNSTRMNHAETAVARLQVTSSDVSFGQVTSGGYDEAGSMVKLSAVANPGYRFTEWRSSTRGTLGTSETLDVQVVGGESITGVFTKMTSEDILSSIFD